MSNLYICVNQLEKVSFLSAIMLNMPKFNKLHYLRGKLLFIY